MYRHQGITKTYKKFKRQFDFPEAKVTIINIIKDYKVYAKIKASRYKPYKKLQILFISNKT